MTSNSLFIYYMTLVGRAAIAIAAILVLGAFVHTVDMYRQFLFLEKIYGAQKSALVGFAIFLFIAGIVCCTIPPSLLH